MKVHLELESDLYGLDEFTDYPTMAKAVEGFNRLIKKAKKYASEDGIGRTVRIVAEIGA